MARPDPADVIELRVRKGLLAVVRGGTALEFRRGRRLFVVDWPATLAGGSAVILEAELEPGPNAEPPLVGGE